MTPSARDLRALAMVRRPIGLSRRAHAQRVAEARALALRLEGREDALAKRFTAAAVALGGGDSPATNLFATDLFATGLSATNLSGAIRAGLYDAPEARRALIAALRVAVETGLAITEGSD